MPVFRLNVHSFVSRLNIKSKLTWHSSGSKLSCLSASVDSSDSSPQGIPEAFRVELAMKVFTYLELVYG